MRLTAILAVALCLSGCEHMYGSIDQGRIAEVARKEALRRHFSVADQVVSVSDRGEVWLVSFDNPPDPPGQTTLGGHVSVSVNKLTRRAHVDYVEQ